METGDGLAHGRLPNISKGENLIPRHLQFVEFGVAGRHSQLTFLALLGLHQSQLQNSGVVHLPYRRILRPDSHHRQCSGGACLHLLLDLQFPRRYLYRSDLVLIRYNYFPVD